MASYGAPDDGSSSLFFSVMDHQNQFQHVTTPEGAFEFNQSFEKPMLEQEKTAPPPVRVEIIDAVARRENDWTGMMTNEWIEYVLKLSINQHMKIVGKRFSELAELHAMLQERRLTDGVRTPPFPEKTLMFNSKDPNNEFIQQRREALAVYLKRLFEVNPNLAYEPAVLAFFELEELGLQAALDTSARTAAHHQATSDPYGGSASSTPAPRSTAASAPSDSAASRTSSGSGSSSMFGGYWGSSSAASSTTSASAAPAPTTPATLEPTEEKSSSTLYDV